MGGYRHADRTELERRRSSAHDRSTLVGLLAFAFLLVGLAFGAYTVLLPALLGLFLLSATWRFVGMRLNPFSVGFYVPVKPSWMAIGVVAVSGALLLGIAWQLFRSGAPIWPGSLP